MVRIPDARNLGALILLAGVVGFFCLALMQSQVGFMIVIIGTIAFVVALVKGY